MIWSDRGYLLSKNKFGENSIIADFFTKNHGKISGIIYGATSKKIKNFLFIGNHFTIQFNSKTQNSVGYFKVEIDKIFTPFFLDDKIKLNCILYSFNLIKILTVENQLNLKIYNHIFKLYELLNKDDWIKKFIFWELEFIKYVGYDINFKDYIDEKKIETKSSYISTLDGSKEIPIFLIENNKEIVKRDELKNGFKIVGDFLNKSILIPNNINYPISRTEFFKLI